MNSTSLNHPCMRNSRRTRAWNHTRCRERENTCAAGMHKPTLARRDVEQPATASTKNPRVHSNPRVRARSNSRTGTQKNLRMRSNPRSRSHDQLARTGKKQFIHARALNNPRAGCIHACMGCRSPCADLPPHMQVSRERLA